MSHPTWTMTDHLCPVIVVADVVAPRQWCQLDDLHGLAV
jgi:hypothetical protein